MREKGTKERTFVRIELPPITPIKRYSFGAATDAHFSGGIVMLFAQMWQYEFRFAALIIFAQGLVGKMGLRLRNEK